MFVGRWQPFHDGHKWLIDQKLQAGVPVLVCVRDIEPDSNNPFTTNQTIDMIQTVYKGEKVEVMKIPDIESINYGRGVGYSIIEHIPPTNISQISGTEIRSKVLCEDDTWKLHVHESIHEKVVQFLTGKEDFDKFMGSGI